MTLKLPKPVSNSAPPTAARADQQINNAISLYSRGQPQEAWAAIRQLLKSQPRNALALNIAGNCFSAMAQPEEAENYWRRALKANPGYAEVHYNLGNLFRGARRFHEAEASYQRAAAINPGFAEAHINLGILFQELKRFPEAEASYRHALAIRPDFAPAHYNLGNLFQDAKRLPEAEDSYRRALAIRPDHAEAHYNLGTVLQEKGALAEAETCYRQALTLRPDHAKAHYNLGRLCHETQRFAEAEASYRRTLVIQPDHAEAHNNLGIVLKETKRFPEAEASYRRALEINPDHAEAHDNLGNLLKDARRFPEAEASYRRALAINPGFVDAGFNLGVLLLYTGRLSEGWPLYEGRYHEHKKEQRITPPPLAYPQWRGESLQGRSIVVWPEQGSGDEIQFVRYLSLLKASGTSRITLVCKPPLRQLFQSIPGADAVITTDEALALPAHDYWTFLLSIPAGLGTALDSIPADIPYLQARPERIDAWKKRLPKSGLRVGLVWKGSSAHKNDRNRSLPGLAALAPLWTVAGASFVSLQKGQGEEEAAAPPPGQPLTHLGSDIKDFADSAAIVSQLDVVICVDTAIAHLAGAMGKPCWVLLPRIGTDWRWLDERSDSPWYPGTMRLFRQAQPDDWSATVLEVAEALRNLPAPSSEGTGLRAYWRSLAGKLKSAG